MWIDDSMAPPHKRRRLSGSASSPSPSRTKFSSADPTPSYAHAVEQIAPYPAPSPPPRPTKHHVQEIYLRLQERAVVSPNEYYHHYPRRQDGTVTLESTITTVDAAGNTILSLVTNTLPTVTTPSTTTTSTPPGGIVGSGTVVTSTSTNSSSTASTATGTGTGTGTSTGSGTGLTSPASASFTTHNNGTSTAHSTGTQRTSKEKSVYVATLTNGNEKTLTRFNKPYVTTFADGESFTVCDRQGDCRLSTQNSNGQSTFSQTFSASNSIPPTSASTAVPGVAGPGSGSTPSASATSTSANNNANPTPPAGAIAGGVVGGAAGLAVILLIALMFFKWYKRRKLQGHQALPPASSPEDDQAFSRSGPGMAERAGIMPLVSAVPAFFRHSGHSDAPPPPAERGFTRVSGRKLPSQFSAGVTGPSSDPYSPRSPPPTMPLTSASAVPDRSLSNTSFYRDSDGFYGGTGTNVNPHDHFNADSPGLPAERHDTSPSESMDRGSPSPPMDIALSPGPRRTPTVHHGGPYLMSPSSSVPATPTIPARFVQSPPSAIPNRSETPSSQYTEERGSRFMEEV